MAGSPETKVAEFKRPVVEELTFVGEFESGDVVLGRLLPSALRPEQEQPAQ